MDEKDFLIEGGNNTVQLTWMDAKIGDWVVTPRTGKCVEINALWYNAISVMKYFHDQLGNLNESKDYGKIADQIKTNFNKAFLNNKTGTLFDFIEGSEKNDDIRPNQIYALALPFPVMDKESGYFIINQVRTELLTPRGLRSLNAANKNYQPTYNGDVWKRDSAYHQGTVWSYLIGAYIDALFYVEGRKAVPEVVHLIKQMLEHADEAGIGTISEIFDANYPHNPCGCIAQAWSVAELLRVLVEYELEEVVFTATKSKTKTTVHVKAHH
jgi:glycogen debranching enzyme